MRDWRSGLGESVIPGTKLLGENVACFYVTVVILWVLVERKMAEIVHLR